MVLLVLTLCTLVSYLGISALFIDWLAVLLKGLFGYGYWLVGPAMLLAAGILLTHHGRPVRLRVSCALLLPMVFGVLGHVLFCKEVYRPSIAILRDLWISGVGLISGGAVSGVLAVGSVAVFAKFVSVVIFLILFAVMLMAALHITPGMLLEKYRSRPHYDYEEEPIGDKESDCVNENYRYYHKKCGKPE